MPHPAAWPMVIVGQMETPESWVEVTLENLKCFQKGHTTTEQVTTHGFVVSKDQLLVKQLQNQEPEHNHIHSYGEWGL